MLASLLLTHEDGRTDESPSGALFAAVTPPTLLDAGFCFCLIGIKEELGFVWAADASRFAYGFRGLEDGLGTRLGLGAAWSIWLEEDDVGTIL